MRFTTRSLFRWLLPLVAVALLSAEAFAAPPKKAGCGCDNCTCLVCECELPTVRADAPKSACIHVSPDGTVNELHADGVYRPVPGAAKQAPVAAVSYVTTCGPNGCSLVPGSGSAASAGTCAGGNCANGSCSPAPARARWFSRR